jgi:hypothetical protein
MRAQEIDTVYHVNGNILTGDFKKMVYGVVNWKMDGMGTISLEQIKVNTVISKKEFEIKLKNNLIYFGSMGYSKEKQSIYIITKDSTKLVDVDDIVEIYPLKKSMWARLNGNFNFGANFSKGSNIGTTSFSGNLEYRKKKTYLNLTWENNLTYQGDSLSSNKSGIGVIWQRLQKNGWSTQVGFSGIQNSELGTKLRLSTSFEEIKNISYNNWNRFYAGAGVSFIRETPYGNSGTQSDVAGVFQLVWKVYKYTLPKVWVNSDLTLLPYITESGRYLVNFNFNPSVSIFSDNFKVGFLLYYNFDSKPTETYSNNDYGLNLTFSYSFH